MYCWGGGRGQPFCFFVWFEIFFGKNKNKRTEQNKLKTKYTLKHKNKTFFPLFVFSVWNKPKTKAKESRIFFLLMYCNKNSCNNYFHNWFLIYPSISFFESWGENNMMNCKVVIQIIVALHRCKIHVRKNVGL